MGNEGSSYKEPPPGSSTPLRRPTAQSLGNPQEFRASTMTTRASTLPRPEHNELEKRFTRVLMSMDLPPDKARVLKNYEDDKKWEIIQDQELVTAKHPPSYYLDMLRVYLDPKGNKHKKKQVLGDATSTQTLRDIEISLRTNQVEWVRDFLNEENQGLDVLVHYLSDSQDAMRDELMSSSQDGDQMLNGSTLPRKNSLASQGSISKAKARRMKPSGSKLNFGEATDDVHVCILCLRAIMNHQYGFNLVFAHNEAINCIALSFNHSSMRTRALVLELLAAVCLVRGGHDITLAAFDNFKEVCAERCRFETLMQSFRNPEEFHIDFMVACMQFINIIVHSVEDVNFRVHLQHEFTLQGLDEYLEDKLRETESETLRVQVNAYLDNLIDVAALLEDSETKTAALERVAELEENLSWEKERAQAAESEAQDKIVSLSADLETSRSETNNFKARCEEQEARLAELEDKLREKESETLKRQSLYENSQKELESLRNNLNSLPRSVDSADAGPPPPAPPPPGPPPPAPPPPPPAPPPPGMGPPPPPPPPGAPPPPGMGIPKSNSALTIKAKLQPKYRLPILNWVAMKPQQVKGTVFSELDDEKLYDVIDFGRFEETFKLGDAIITSDESTPKTSRKAVKKQETISLLESNRMRNVAIARRKMEIGEDAMVKAINSLDLQTLSLDRVEILQRVVPTDTEIKAFREYEKEKKPINALSDEDKFMIKLWKIERLSSKLQIMSFIGNFFDTRNILVPQIQAVIAASRSIRKSTKVRKMLEVILAFGNYMNGSKRGTAYGFKLQSLDMLLEAKTSDKKLTLLHYIVKTVQEKFPQIQNFDNELSFLEKASTVSLENILTDINEQDKGMELTKKEYNLRKEREPEGILHTFLSKAEDMMRDLKADSKSAEEAYSTVVEFFGENPKTLAPNTFFSLFVRFVKSYRQAVLDLENMKKAEQMQLATQESIRLKKAANQSRKNQDNVMAELKNNIKQRVGPDKKAINPDDMYHGALEDLLLGMKNAPYRRADAARKSQRRRIERGISNNSNEIETEHL